MFGEKDKEYSVKHNGEIPVWQSPKYQEAKAKAIEIINSKKYGLSEADFWILMNTTKSGKMAYTSLIISHNGCLKINDNLDDKFKPECVTLDKDGYNESLVYTYMNAEQGIYEVGEVAKGNCQNAYPYAMAFKRLFDRVVLKLSKLAYSGIMSDSESEEFTDPQNDTETEATGVTTEMLTALIELGKSAGVNNPVNALCKRYGTDNLINLSLEQYNEAKAGFEAVLNN